MERTFGKPEAVFLATITWIPFLVRGSHLQYLMILTAINGIVAIGLNLFLGFGGQISLCHGAFFGIGGYVTAILTTRCQIDFSLAFILSAASAWLLAWIIGWPLLRLKGYFLALATFGFGEIFTVVVSEMRNITNGIIGIYDIPFPGIGNLKFNTPIKQLYLVWGLLFFLLLFAKNLVNSKTGRALKALALNEDVSSTLGIKPAKIKVNIFAISALYAGMAGSIFVGIISTCSPGPFGIQYSVMAVMMVIIGGATHLYGSILGAVLLTLITHQLGKYQEYSLLIYGLVLILMMIYMPGGVWMGIAKTVKYMLPSHYRKDEDEDDL